MPLEIPTTRCPVCGSLSTSQFNRHAPLNLPDDRSALIYRATEAEDGSIAAGALGSLHPVAVDSSPRRGAYWRPLLLIWSLMLVAAVAIGLVIRAFTTPAASPTTTTIERTR